VAARDSRAVTAVGTLLVSYELPVNKPTRKRASATTPSANTVSPSARIQRNVPRWPECKKLDERAYQVPRSIAAAVCASPMGSRLSSTINTSPALSIQNDAASVRSFQCRVGCSPRRQNSKRPMPSMP
jgi:hypothetical protein